MVRGWLAHVLDRSEFHVAGTAAGFQEAIELLRRRRADVLLVDYHLPDSRGTDLVRRLRREGSDIPAILMTANAEPGFNELAREAGAQGSVLKTGSADELLGALRALLTRSSAFDSRYPSRPADRVALSPRERDVLRLIAAGKTNRQIAGTLGIGEESVKTLLSRGFAKLGVHRRAEAVAAAHQHGLILL